MAKTWINSDKYTGVRWYEHSTRRHGVQPDRRYAIRYQLDGKRMEYTLGWASAGETEKSAMLARERYLENYRTGNGPISPKEETAEAQAKREAERAARKAEEVASVTLDGYWPRYARSAKGRGMKATSFRREEDIYTLHLKPVLGDVPLRDMDLGQWDRLTRRLDRQGKAQRTKEYITGVLRRVLKHAYERKVIDEAPPTGKRVGVTAPKDNRRTRAIRPDEARAILEHMEAKDEHGYRYTLFAFLTGARVSEISHLEWRDVDLEARTVAFRKTKNADTRTLAIDGELLDLLSSIQEGKPTDNVFTRNNGTPFINANGRPERPWSFRAAVDELGLNVGREQLDKIVFHSIRHSVATNLAKRLNLRDLMEIMGWKNVSMAMRYVKGDEESQRTALTSLGVRVKGGKVIDLHAGKVG